MMFTLCFLADPALTLLGMALMGSVEVGGMVEDGGIADVVLRVDFVMMEEAGFEVADEEAEVEEEGTFGF